MGRRFATCSLFAEGAEIPQVRQGPVPHKMRTTVAGPYLRAGATQVIMATCGTHSSSWGEIRIDPINPAGELVLVRSSGPNSSGSSAGARGALCVVLPVVSIQATDGLRLGLGNVKYVQDAPKSKTRIDDATSQLYLIFSEEGRFVGSDMYKFVDNSGCGRGVGSLIVNYAFEVIHSRSWGDAYQRLSPYGDAARTYALRALISASRGSAVRIPGTNGRQVYLIGSGDISVLMGRWIGGRTHMSSLPPGSVPVGTTIMNDDGAVIHSTVSACTMTGSAACITDFPGLRVYKTITLPRFRLYSNTNTFCLPNGTEIARDATADLFIIIAIGYSPYPRIGSLGSLVGIVGEGYRVMFNSPEDGDTGPGGRMVIKRACTVRILRDMVAYRIDFPHPPILAIGSN
jgi:hypothetical protein